jgi:hypothetical protein
MVADDDPVRLAHPVRRARPEVRLARRRVHLGVRLAHPEVRLARLGVRLARRRVHLGVRLARLAHPEDPHDLPRRYPRVVRSVHCSAAAHRVPHRRSEAVRSAPRLRAEHPTRWGR